MIFVGYSQLKIESWASNDILIYASKHFQVIDVSQSCA